MIEQTKFTYSPLGKWFKKIKDQGRKQVEALKILKPANNENQNQMKTYSQKISDIMKFKKN